MAAAADPPAPDPLLGSTLGGYRLVTELGNGGMGTVYYGEHLVIGRRAAIKVLRAEVAASAEAVARFVGEARAVNDIRHPNVVEITDLGAERGLHYIVMALLEGETLGERLERAGALDERAALRIARQIAAALGAAHERGIVHRDLKPENVFLTNHPDYPDQVKVLDFGIAKLMHPEDRASRRTAEGMLIGTPHYMSPEQCRGQSDLDHRSDVYALGVVLYQMLTGVVPFDGQLGEIIIAHATEPPRPPRALRPDLGAHSEAVVLRALEKEPARRFPDMRALRDALEGPPRRAPLAAAPAGETPQQRERRERREAENVTGRLAESIRERVAKDRLVLPAMPGVALECAELLRDPRHTFARVAAVAGRDPLLASRVLKLANSAAFPSLSPATTLEQAIARMGTAGRRMAPIEFSLHSTFSSRDDRIAAAFKAIWQHSLAVAVLARDLAQRLGAGAPDPGAAYLAGLLHDIGKPVVGSLLLEAERAAADGAWISDAVWRSVVEACHREVGTALVRHWRLAPEVAQAVERCHEWDRAAPRSCVNLVRLANALAKQEGLHAGASDAAALEALVQAGCALIQVDPAALAAVRAGLHGRVATLLDAPSPRRRAA